LEEVIGKRGNNAGSLMDYHIAYNGVDLSSDGTIDYPGIQASITEKTKVIGIQRSKGYDDRPSFTIEESSDMVAFVKEINKDLIVCVDNCYAEFVETSETLHVGADIIAGSLLKNPGGGIVRAGGYIAG